MSGVEGFSPQDHIDEAKRLIGEANQHVSDNFHHQTGELKQDVLLASIAHSLASIAEMYATGWRR